MRLRFRVSAAVGVVFLGGHLAAASRPAARPQAASLDAVLDRSAAYLDGYAKRLAAVVATEDYTFRGSTILNPYRSLQSDVLLVGIDAGWIEFRDVFEVNHEPVRDHDARLQALFANPSADLLDQAAKIADESARYNMGFERTINVPTMALSYLTRRLQPRSTFRLDGQTSIRGTRATIVRFKETAKPSLIKVAIGTAETSGRFWIADDTGAVLRTALSLQVPRGTVSRASEVVDGTVTVDYNLDPALQILLPAKMTEHYELPQRIDGAATYSNFRSFGVDVSTLMRKGGGG